MPADMKKILDHACTFGVRMVKDNSLVTNFTGKRDWSTVNLSS